MIVRSFVFISIFLNCCIVVTHRSKKILFCICIIKIIFGKFGHSYSDIHIYNKFNVLLCVRTKTHLMHIFLFCMFFFVSLNKKSLKSKHLTFCVWYNQSYWVLLIIIIIIIINLLIFWFLFFISLTLGLLRTAVTPSVSYGLGMLHSVCAGIDHILVWVK